ncbi:four-carbon acid sugar kinase family protein [Streptomyces hygroscopicus]|uniref:four-carbon acid sugar kinase family protein n=1 Tax=Streptomyces hygroscopicus TaxID=1912 RepID=UPI0033F5B13A
MTTGRMLLAIADDLSGAAETAAALHSRTTRSRVLLVGRPDEGDGGASAAARPPHGHNDALTAAHPPHPGEGDGGAQAAPRPRHPGEGDGGALAASHPRRPGERDGGAPTAARPPHGHNDALAASRPPHPHEGDGSAQAAPRPRRPGEGDSGALAAAHPRRPGERDNGAPTAPRPPHPGEATVLDLDSRYRPAAEAAEAVRDALRLSSPDGDTLVLKKIDSLLRGNLAAEIGALAEDGAGVVLAPALPVGGRVVRSGVVYVNGVALHESDAWRLEATPAPRSIAEALDGLPTTPIPLSTVRAPGHWLLSALRTAMDHGRVAVCDAETDADLDAIVEASLAAGPRLRLVGSGGLALALGRRLAATPSPTVTRAATLAPRSTTPGTATSALTSTTPGTANQAPVRDTASRANPASPGPDTAAPAATPPSPSTTPDAATPAPPPDTAARTTPPSPGPDTAAPAATPPSPSTTPDATTPAPPRDTAARAATPAATSTTPGATNQAPPPDTAAPATPPSPGTGRRVLVVVGTAEPAAVEQIRRLVEDGAIHHPLPLDALIADGPPVRLPPMTAPVTVVSLSAPSGPPPAAPGPATPHTPTSAPAPGAAALPSPRPAPEATARGPLSAATPPSGGGADDRTEPDRMGPNPTGPNRTGPNPTEPHLREPDRAGPDFREPDPAGPDHTEPDRGPDRGPEPPSARRLVHGLARAVRDAVAAHPGALDLVLTGGETARRVLDALAVTELDPVGQVHHGAVHLSTPDGRSVVTRPGSFGDPDSLRRIVQALRPHPTERKVTS